MASSTYTFTATDLEGSASQFVGTSSSGGFSTNMVTPTALSKLYGMLVVFAVDYGALANGTYMSGTNTWNLAGTYDPGGFTVWNVSSVTVNGTTSNIATIPASTTVNSSTAGAIAQSWLVSPFSLYGQPSTSYTCTNTGFATTASMTATYTMTLYAYYPAGLMSAS